MSDIVAVMMCDKCKRVMQLDELTRKFTISPFYVCRDYEDCARATRCGICQHQFIHRGAS